MFVLTHTHTRTQSIKHFTCACVCLCVGVYPRDIADGHSGCGRWRALPPWSPPSPGHLLVFRMHRRNFLTMTSAVTVEKCSRPLESKHESCWWMCKCIAATREHGFFWACFFVFCLFYVVFFIPTTCHVNHSMVMIMATKFKSV